MTRLTLALAALLASLSPAMAMLSPHNNQPALGKDALPTSAKDAPADAAKPAAAAAPKEEKQQFVITDDTEVQLDGKACKFGDVPETASVSSLDVGPDKKTVLKIHFKSKK